VTAGRVALEKGRVVSHARNLTADFKYSFRSLWRRSGFTLVAVLTLALGIGATTATYTVVDAVLLRALPFPEAERLVSVRSTLRGQPVSSSYLDARDFRARSSTLAELAVYQEADVALTGVAQPLQLKALESSSSLFRTLGVVPARGRVFDENDERSGGTVAVLSHALWREQYGADPSAVGRAIQIDGASLTIVGVAPPEFQFPLDVGAKESQIYLLYPRTAEQLVASNDRSSRRMKIVARTKPGVSVKQVQADFAAVVSGLRHDQPKTSRQLGVQISTLGDQLVKPVRPSLLLLLGSVVGLLFIACINVAGLILARAVGRGRELAIRTALGASRVRMVRLMLIESTLIALVGGAIGALLASGLLSLLETLIAPAIPKVRDLAIDLRVLAVTLVLALVTGLASGLWPALHGSRTKPDEALKGASRSTTDARSRRARQLFLTGEMAIAVILLMGAGLTMRSFSLLNRANPGFATEGVVVAQLQLPTTRYPDEKAQDLYYRRLSTTLAALPGAEAVGFGAPLPFSDLDMAVSVAISGRPSDPEISDAMFAAVSPSYFKAIGIPFVAGRGFSVVDDQPGAAPVVIISQTFARRMFGDPAEALGKRLQIGIGNKMKPEVIGVSADTRYASLDQAIVPQMYMPLGRLPIGVLGVVVRANALASQSTMASVRRALLEVDHDLPPPLLASIDSLVEATKQKHRALAIVLMVFAVLALALASLGVYGFISYSVAERTREFGIRIALGADRGRVLRLVMRETLKAVLVAVPAGVVVALAAAEGLRSILFGVSRLDPVTLGLVPAIIVTVALLASLLPARRATEVEPMIAMHHE
jgi:putative ABC transport system permease protein